MNNLLNFHFLNRKKFIIFQCKDKSKIFDKIKTIKAKERKQILPQNKITIDFAKTQINDRNAEISLKF